MGTFSTIHFIHGDNLLALKALLSTHEGAPVKCIYIDPPFNTQQALESTTMESEHSIWLSLMRGRLEIIDVAFFLNRRNFVYAYRR